MTSTGGFCVPAILLLSLSGSAPASAATRYNDPQHRLAPGFTFTYSPDIVLSPAAAAAMEAEFRQAYTEVSRRIGATAAVRVHVRTDGATIIPALYEAQSDTITIWSKWFAPSVGHSTGFSAAKLRQLTCHDIRHELAHLLLTHRVGVGLFRRRGNYLPLWLLEGFAEWGAGGAQNACCPPGQVKPLFTNGVLDPAALRLAMAVDGRPKTIETNHKAYIQSFFMVTYLLGHSRGPGEPLTRLLAFILDLMDSAGRFELCLRKHYGHSIAQFDCGWTALLNHYVIAAPEPQLTNTAVVD